MKNPKMQSFYDLGPPIKSDCHVARRIGRKTLFFVPKVFKNTKIAPNSLKFGLSHLYQVL